MHAIFRPRAAGALALAILVLVLAPLGASAQDRSSEDADARSVAAYVQTFYDQTSSYEASFYQVFYNRLYQRYDRSYGRLAIAKDGHRMRFDYARPNGKVLVCSEDALTIWEPGAGNDPGQVMSGRVDRSAAAGAFGFLTGETRLGETHSFRILDARRYRWDGYVLELTPQAENPRFRKVLLFVDAAASRRGVVHKVRIYDHDGNINHFTLRSARFNPSFASDRFDLDVPASVPRVRLGA